MGAECLNRLLCEGVETDDCCRQIEALKNGRGEGSCPVEMCHEGSSINILIKASQALESPREMTAFSTHTGGPKPLSQRVNGRTFKFCQYCIVRVLAFPKESPKCLPANMLR